MFLFPWIALLLSVQTSPFISSAEQIWDSTENPEDSISTTTEATTLSTTTLGPDQCAECHEHSLCIEWAYPDVENNTICDKCACPKGRTGKCCETLVDLCAQEPNSCPNSRFNQHRSCKMHENGMFVCECDAGFTGRHCTTEIRICSPNPCKNRGTCYEEEDGGFSCECSSRFTGEFCEIPMDCYPRCYPCGPRDRNGCDNNSTCWPYNDRTYKYACICRPGWKGGACKEEVPCELSNPCQHGGVCYRDTVEKKDTSTKEEKKDDDDDDDDDTSNYLSSFWKRRYGTTTTTTTTKKPIEYEEVAKCECPSIWKGDFCEEFNQCYEEKCLKGKCFAVNATHSACRCFPGWTGELCEIDIDECDPNPCEYNTTCTDMENNFLCDCPLGTSGKNCSINFDDCKDEEAGVKNVCATRDREATCTDGLNEYICSCSDEWTGENCTMRMVIWNVLSMFKDTDVDIVALLEELVGKPSLIKDFLPFFLAQMKDQSGISWDHEDLFTWVTFEGQELDLKKDMVKWNAATLGNCFTFNHDSQPEKMPLRYAGEQEGFRALMRVRQDEYLDWIDTASLLVFVHSSTESVFGESLRFQARPGGETSLMISQTSFERLGGKYGVCVKDKSEVKSYYYAGEYTTDGCLRSCYQDAVFESCGCMDPRFPIKQDTKACDLSKRVCTMAISSERGDPSQWEECNCPLPCSNGQYVAKWSYNAYQPLDCKKLSSNATTYERCLSDGKDKALISVSLPLVIQNHFKEEPKMDFNKFIANLGGLLGVLCGICIITFFEIAYLIVRLFVVLVSGQ